MLDIARSYSFSPYKLAKLYVKHILRQKDTFNLTKLLNNDFQHATAMSGSETAHSDTLTGPPLVDSSTTSHTSTDNTSTLIDSTSVCMCDRLKSELIQCCLQDALSSQTSESLKNCSGREFEELLYSLMRQQHMVSGL